MIKESCGLQNGCGPNQSEEYQWYRPIRVKEARFIKKCITDWEAEHLLRFSYFSYINRAMMAIRMIKILKAYCLEQDICLIAKKSNKLYSSKQTSVLSDTTLNGKFFEWVDQWNYLGIALKSGTFFSCSVSDRIKKFYDCVNAILKIDGRSDELTMLQLLESHCIQLLIYAVEIVHV